MRIGDTQGYMFECVSVGRFTRHHKFTDPALDFRRRLNRLIFCVNLFGGVH